MEVLKRVSKDNFVSGKNIYTHDPLQIIQKVQDKYVLEKVGRELPSFCGGLVGYMGYEMIGTWEKIDFKNPSNPELPLGIFIFIDEFIVFDHMHNTAEVIRLVNKAKGDPESVIKQARERVEDITGFINSSLTPMDEIPLGISPDIEVKSNLTEDEFKRGVTNIKEEIFTFLLFLNLHLTCSSF